MPGGRGGGRGCGGRGRKRRRGHQQQHHSQQRPAVDPGEFERQLEEQRRRQQRQESAASAAAPAPRFLRGFEYDTARQRFFPRPRGRGRGSSAASALQRGPQGGQSQPLPRPPLPGLPALRGGVWARLLERERTGRGRAGALMGSVAQGSINRERLQRQDWEHNPVADMDVLRDRVAVVAGLQFSIYRLRADEDDGEPNSILGEEVRAYDSSPITQVRWRVSADSTSSTAAVLQPGHARSGGITLYTIDDRWAGTGLRRSHFGMQSDLWALEWEPEAGDRLLVGMGTGDPISYIDVRESRWVRPYGTSCSLATDCHALAWLGRENALLGLRNGEVRLADFRTPPPRGRSGDNSTTAALPLLSRMHNIVDQLAVLRDGRGLVASDRLGGLRLADLRMPGRTVRDLLLPPSGPSATLASTGFALEPMTEAVCITLMWDGTAKLLSLAGSAGEDPLLRSWPVVPPSEVGTWARFFLARRWTEGRWKGPWAPLWCGSRGEERGDIYALVLSRDEAPE